MAAGERLPNGTIVLMERSSDIQPKTAYRTIVLGFIAETPEFVTYRRERSSDTPLATGGTQQLDECFWGHYHRLDIEDAVADYRRRETPGDSLVSIGRDLHRASRGS